MTQHDEAAPPRLSGRREQAARNDEVILRAAREVFLDDPGAPIAAVAQRAGVGISALYRRYQGKEDLLRQLCHDGLRQFLAIAQQARANLDDWAAFAAFLTGVVDADVHSLTVHLAGTFTPTAEMEQDARAAQDIADALLERARASGRLRPGIVSGDIALILEGCAAIRLPDPERSRQLRMRHLAILLDGLQTGAGPPAGGSATEPGGETASLPGPAPRPGELNYRWQR
jgi:AcrR family transcriptional regulator